MEIFPFTSKSSLKLSFQPGICQRDTWISHSEYQITASQVYSMAFEFLNSYKDSSKDPLLCQHLWVDFIGPLDFELLKQYKEGNTFGFAYSLYLKYPEQ